MASKGYVVKRTICDGVYSYPCTSLGNVFEEWREMVALGALAIDIYRVHPDGREERLPSYEEALGALSILRDEVQAAQDYKRGGMSCGGPPLLWTCPPSALKELLRLADGAPVADPLAALEAAERRLLEAGGWTPGDRGFWIDPDDGTQWPREGAISDVRRRLAAKGGAT